MAQAFDGSETGGFVAAGDLIRLRPHGAASENRAALGVSGQDVQSAHLAPQSAMKPNVKSYNADHALTFLLERSAHQGMDKSWKQTFTKMRQAGETTATAQRVYDVVADAIAKAPGIEAGEKRSLAAALHDEMFSHGGLSPGDVLALPYPNVKAKPKP